MNHYHFTTCAQRPGLVDAAREVNGRVWPEFMFHDAVADRLWDRLEGTFADYRMSGCSIKSLRRMLIYKEPEHGTRDAG